MDVTIWFWVAFLVAVAIMLAIDLGIFESGEEGISLRAASIWTAVWISVSLAFGAGLYWWQGAAVGLEFLTAYLIEKSLSLDNIFVFVVIFRYFNVPAKFQHRVLFWGVIGAVIMRGAFIFAGIALLNSFDWMIYVFGVFLVYTAYRMATTDTEDTDPTANPVVRFLRNRLPMVDDFAEGRFVVRRDGQLFMTRLLLVLVVIEATDVLFAVDSVPAVLGVTDSAFIAFTSNILAVLGLRALYFVLAGTVEKFVYLDLALSFVLGFVGVKMLLSGVLHVPIWLSLIVILGAILVGVVASVIAQRSEAGEGA